MRFFIMYQSFPLVFFLRMILRYARRRDILKDHSIASITQKKRKDENNTITREYSQIINKKVKFQNIDNIITDRNENEELDELKQSTWKSGITNRIHEKKLLKKGYTIIAGVDEAGRGPLAGPVVAAACYIPFDVHIDGIDDSKKLNAMEREELFEKLTNHPKIKHAIHINDHSRIDEINILQASLESMSKAVQELNVNVDYVLVDGSMIPKNLDMECAAIIKGDRKIFSIAAASIIAKVTRDRIMIEYDKKWPMYGFSQHKGYPTKSHIASIFKHGPCPIHRMTFAPLKNL